MSAGNYFEYETWTFTQDLVESGNLYRSRDLLSASLEVDTLNITVECNDPSIVNFRRNAKLTRYFNGAQDGIFYVQSIKRVLNYTPLAQRRKSDCFKTAGTWEEYTQEKPLNK